MLYSRLKHVFSRISEEKFWTNYAYRLTLIEKLVGKNKFSVAKQKIDSNSSDSSESKEKAESKQQMSDDNDIKQENSTGVQFPIVYFLNLYFLGNTCIDDQELERELLSDIGDCDYEMVSKNGNEKSDDAADFEEEIEDLLKSEEK